MTSRLLSTACAAAVAFAAWTAPARADLVTVAWSYSSTPTATVNATTGGGSLTLSGESLTGMVGNSNIVPINVVAHSDALAGAPDVYTNAGYSLQVSLKDDLSGDHTTLTFQGAFNGTLSKQGADLSNTFTAGANQTLAGGTIAQTVTLGGNQYTFSVGPLVGPAQSGASNAGAFGGHVSIVPGDSVGHPTSTPEPSALLLAGLGGLGALGVRFRRRRAAQPA